jgi:hypothetical protein
MLTTQLLSQFNLTRRADRNALSDLMEDAGRMPEAARLRSPNWVPLRLSPGGKVRVARWTEATPTETVRVWLHLARKGCDSGIAEYRMHQGHPFTRGFQSQPIPEVGVVQVMLARISTHTYISRLEICPPGERRSMQNFLLDEILYNETAWRRYEVKGWTVYELLRQRDLLLPMEPYEN